MTSPVLDTKTEEWSLPELEKTSKSMLMQDIYYKILQIAKLETHVILIGEMGSGKKRLAQLIHQHSKRSTGPFYSFYGIDIDDAEYKDAFWGHLHFDDEFLTLKYEALERSSGGILYLDQFSELSPYVMLKIIESYKKGCNQLFRYDKHAKPRLIISLNQESYQPILNTPVWETLLTNLDPMVIMVPPLRERKEDIPTLINSFLQEIKEKSMFYKDLSISNQALSQCSTYHWPGNIRQLKNAIMQGAILSYGKTIETEHLPFSMSWQLPYQSV